MTMGARKTATEDKCDGSWAYVSSYIYHQPLAEAQKSRESAQIATPGSQNLGIEGQVHVQTLVQALDTLFT